MKRIYEPRSNAPQILRQSKGHVFSVSFVKRTTGTIRTMNCRTGVSKGVKGTGRNFEPDAHGLMSVYDMHQQGFRMINLDQLLTARVRGAEYIFY